MKYHDLRDFIAQLESQGELKRVGVPVSPHLEMTEICDRVLRAGGPAVRIVGELDRGAPCSARLDYQAWDTQWLPYFGALPAVLCDYASHFFFGE